MKSKEILEKAIQKAIDGGWERNFKITSENIASFIELVSGELPQSAYALIFNPNFAKALWGEELINVGNGVGVDTHFAWQYHIQQMVIADDPVKYLGENT